MCGLAGWFSSSPLADNANSILAAMLKRIKHRGPDGNGVWLEDQIALCHSRLAIIDLSQGQQPMHSYDRSTVISFNGEIYNYQELRRQLSHKDYRFTSNSDTEVIMALYQIYGIQGFDKLRGMYAFVLWDKTLNTGYMVRDPLGIKPLFYYRTEKELIFASEAKAILIKHPECAKLNVNNLHLLMNFRYLPGSRSLFQNIYQLDPGQIIIWQANAPLRYEKIQPESSNDENQSILAVLTNSMQAHTAADVEIGAYLSGGVDSATLCALAKQLYKQKIKTFTLDIGDDPNESKNAKRSADLLGLENISQSVDFDISKQMQSMVWHLEVPKVNSLQIDLLARLTSQHVKVALSGLGADELFTGYQLHHSIYKCMQLQSLSPKFLNKMIAGSLAFGCNKIQSIPYSEKERFFSVISNLGNWPKVYGLFRNIWDNNKLRCQIYGPRMLDQTLDSAFDTIEDLWPNENNPLIATLKFENQQKLINDLLWQEDRLSMAHGLEVRVPFVDHYVKEAAANLSIDQLMPNGKLKHFLKQSVKPLLNAEIINRQKSGFQINAPEFFHKHFNTLTKRYLTPDITHRLGLFNPKFIAKILKTKPKKRLRWHYFMLILMIQSHIWLEQFEQTE